MNNIFKTFNFFRNKNIQPQNTPEIIKPSRGIQKKTTIVHQKQNIKNVNKHNNSNHSNSSNKHLDIGKHIKDIHHRFTPYKIPTPKKQRKESIPKRLRELVWTMHNGDTYSNKCYVDWCNNTINVFNFQVGHDIPESKGGKTEINNLKPICSNCNLSMGNKFTINEWNKLVFVNINKSIEPFYSTNKENIIKHNNIQNQIIENLNNHKDMNHVISTIQNIKNSNENENEKKIKS